MRNDAVYLFSLSMILEAAQELTKPDLFFYSNEWTQLESVIKNAFFFVAYILEGDVASTPKQETEFSWVKVRYGRWGNEKSAGEKESQVTVIFIVVL